MLVIGRGHRDRAEDGREVRFPLAGNQDRPDHRDRGDGIGQRHERRVEQPGDVLNDLEPDERRQHEDEQHRPEVEHSHIAATISPFTAGCAARSRPDAARVPASAQRPRSAARPSLPRARRRQRDPSARAPRSPAARVSRDTASLRCVRDTACSARATARAPSRSDASGAVARIHPARLSTNGSSGRRRAASRNAASARRMSPFAP